MKAIKILLIIITSTLFLFSDEPEKIQKLSPRPWQIQSTLGLTLTAGNSDTQILTFDSDIRKPFERFLYYTKINLSYGTSRYGQGPRIETTNNWLLLTRIDWFLTDQRKSFLFTQFGISGNKFRGYWTRRSAQIGIGYNFFHVDTLKLKLALGVDYSKDNLVIKGSADDEIFFSVIKPEFEFILNKNAKIGNTANCFIDFQEIKNYRITSQTYLNFKITNRLALNFTFTLNYDNKPRYIAEVDETGRPTGRKVLAKPADKIFNTGLSITI